jgi:predicted RNA binding protein YcfA (HicA-like mRNA interferase family)
MNYGELTRRLRRLGIRLYRQGKGSHETWWDPEKKLFTIIQHHQGREIPNGTLRAILRDLQLTEDDLRNV